MKLVLKVILVFLLLIVAGVSTLGLFLYFKNGHIGVETDYSASIFLKDKPAPLEEPLTLKIITFNIQDLFVVGRNRPARMRHIARVLGDLDPDIVGFQESFVGKDRDVLIKALETTRLRHHQYYSSSVGGSGLLISSAWPIREVFYHRYSVSGPPQRIWEGDFWAGKGVALARIETPAGMLDFYNTHAQAGYGRISYREVRRTQMAELAAFMNGTRTQNAPAFLVSDMNCSIGDVDYETVAGNAGLTRLMAIDSHIDHIFTAHNDHHAFEVLDTVMIAERISEDGMAFGLSDHNGYMSTIRITPSPAVDPLVTVSDSDGAGTPS